MVQSVINNQLIVGLFLIDNKWASNQTGHLPKKHTISEMLGF
jgi:hypothetical protein